jgi:hypothetical protein
MVGLAFLAYIIYGRQYQVFVGTCLDVLTIPSKALEITLER